MLVSMVRFGFLALLLLLAIAATAQQIQDEITVERVIIDARVTNGQGEPILGLTSADFRVRIDGKPARIESVVWVPETEAARAIADLDRPPAVVNETTDIPAPRGRLLVFFFQTDIAKHPSRVRGQMKIIEHADALIDSLEPEDRVAVLQFDSHLKFRLDFTGEKARLQGAVRDTLLANEPNVPPVVPMPSLARRLSRDDMMNAATIEESLIVLANALRPIPGPKSVILFGWGLGRMTSSGVTFSRDYSIARRALESSRATVFSLDITDADYHTLEAGLQKVSGDTGGFYAKTHMFPKLAFDRLKSTLAGHYELEVRKPAKSRPGVHTIDVLVPKRRGANILARASYVDGE